MPEGSDVKFLAKLKKQQSKNKVALHSLYAAVVVIFARSLTRLLTHPLTHSLAHPLTHPLTHSLSLSFAHSLTRLGVSGEILK